ncbi:MAG: TetR/AcrR family transcriptional regulator [Actinomycetales bacterium]
MDGLTPRQRARVETTRRIKDLALGQLATSGAGELSLRAIARELNLVSSAVYRYYPSRDDLVTDLIVDAYEDLAERLGTASCQEATDRQAWIRAALTLREWAVDAPHRFALIYGSPIPAYTAPERTIAPAARVVAVLMSVAVAGRVPAEAQLPSLLARQLSTAAELFDSGGAGAAPVASERTGTPTPHQVLAFAAAFSQLIGALTLELGGHFVGTFTPADELYAALVDSHADALGLSDAPRP